MDVRHEVRQLAEPLAEELGYEVVDVELAYQGRHRVIRVLLDSPSGITIGDCARFSRRLADCLDMNQTVAGSYRLEVSSPGIERPITTLEQAVRFAGSRVGLTTHEPREGRRNFEGELLGAREGRTGIRGEDGVEHWFEWRDVRTLKLIVDPWEGSRRRTEGRARVGLRGEAGRPAERGPRGESDE